jgi:hypothetical protein
VVLVAGILAAVLLLGGEDPEPQVTLPLPEETTQGTVTNPAVDQLLAYVPPEATNCGEASVAPEYGAVLASVVCDSVADPRANVAFFLYESPEAAGGAYQAIQLGNNLPTDTGDCETGVPGETGWSGGGGAGRLGCGLSGDLAAVLWSSDGYPVLAQVTADTTELTVQDVYNIWLGISDYSAS